MLEGVGFTAQRCNLCIFRRVARGEAREETRERLKPHDVAAVVVSTGVGSVCIPMKTQTHTDMQTQTCRQRQTDRHTDTQTHTHTHRQTHTNLVLVWVLEGSDGSLFCCKGLRGFDPRRARHVFVSAHCTVNRIDGGGEKTEGRKEPKGEWANQHRAAATTTNAASFRVTLSSQPPPPKPSPHPITSNARNALHVSEKGIERVCKRVFFVTEAGDGQIMHGNETF